MRAIALMMSVDLSMTIAAAGAEGRLHLAQAVEIHRAVDDVLGLDDRAGRAAGNDRQQVVPAAADAAGVLVDQFAEGDAHRLFDRAGTVDVAGDHEQLGADVVRAADRREPGRAAAQDGRGDGDRFDVVDRRRAAVEAHVGRERRLQARLALLALEAFQQRGFFAADIGAGAVMDVDVDVPAVLVVLAEQAGVIALVDRRLQRLALAHVFAAHVDIGGVGAHGEAKRSRSLRSAYADRGA